MSEIAEAKKGRPFLTIDWEMINKILSKGGRVPDVVFLTGVSAATLARRIQDEHGLTFSEYRELQLSETRMKILNTQLEVALEKKDPMMLKHLGEHFCGQVSQTHNKNLSVTTSVEDFFRKLHEEDQNAG